MISIKNKLMIALLLTAFIPLVSMGSISYYQTNKIFAGSIQDSLLNLMKSKEAVLENYIKTTEMAAKTMGDTHSFQVYINLSARKDELKTRELVELKRSKKYVEDILYNFQETHWNQYHHVFLIDRSEKIIISPNHGKQVKGSPSSHLNEDASHNKWLTQALQSGKTTVSDYSSWVESDHNHQMLFFAVKGEYDKIQAVIGFELQIPYEQKLLTENLELGKTGKVFLATADGTPILYNEGKKQNLLDPQGLLEAKQKGYSSALRKNSKDVKVIDLYLKNSKYPWIIVAEIEAQEVFRNLNAFQKSMGILALVIFILAIFIAFLLSNLIVNPIKQLTGQMEQVSMGKMDIEITGMERDDEIGQLVRAFNRTITSLKIMMKRYNNQGSGS